MLKNIDNLVGMENNNTKDPSDSYLHTKMALNEADTNINLKYVVNIAIFILNQKNNKKKRK